MGGEGTVIIFRLRQLKGCACSLHWEDAYWTRTRFWMRAEDAFKFRNVELELSCVKGTGLVFRSGVDMDCCGRSDSWNHGACQTAYGGTVEQKEACVRSGQRSRVCWRERRTSYATVTVTRISDRLLERFLWPRGFRGVIPSWWEGLLKEQLTSRWHQRNGNGAKNCAGCNPEDASLVTSFLQRPHS